MRGTLSILLALLADPGPPPGRVSFQGEVLPILTRLGCNAGACHGKSGGQNGFHLSLFGSDPSADFESLAREDRGRRIFPARPEASLFLLKPTARLPHRGGKRLEPDSPGFLTLAQWIRQGARADTEPRLLPVALEVRPDHRRVAPGTSQQIRVVARTADGSEKDVTALCLFSTSDENLATIDERGRVLARTTGRAAILARYGSLVGTASIVVPRPGRVARTAREAPRNFVDVLVEEGLDELGIAEGPTCDDATFARRSSLDLRGILPSPAEVIALENDADPDKRRRWVDRLLDSREYADHFALLWSTILRNQRTLGSLSMPGTFAFHAWIREAIAENRPYDRFVGELLTATGDPASNPAVAWYRRAATEDALADETAQLFLGLRLQCARCHQHPTDRWGPSDYHAFAAFFRRIGLKPGGDPATPRVFLSDKNPDADRPRFPGAREAIVIGSREDPRSRLAQWLVAPDNPYFARTVVNRYWKTLIGRGLVEPEDDFRPSNPPTFPALLDGLSAQFISHHYDLKWLVRTIATSRVYERSSELSDGNREDRSGLARFLPRRMTAEMLLDAIDTLTGVPTAYPDVPEGTRAGQLPDEGFDTPGRFLEIFGRPKRATVCECERSNDANLAQSLHLLNSEDVEGKLRHPQGRAALMSGDSRADREKIDELYRLAFARAPSAEELATCRAHLDRCRKRGSARSGYEDLVWTLLNAKEFQFIP